MYDPKNSKHLFQRVIMQSGVTRINSLFSNNITEELKIQEYLYKKILGRFKVTLTLGVKMSHFSSGVFHDRIYRVQW